MNSRVLELIKNPELFQKQDLEILNSEIKKQPYIQNIRALYLYGIYTHQPENYPKELSTTAAYTTDKKILYQFINKKEIAEKAPNLFISGHSHILKAMYDQKNNLLHLNPGACGKEGWHKTRTMMRFEINGDKIENLEVIELGKR